MFDLAREKAAHAVAQAAVAERTVKEARKRSILVALSPDEATLRTAWAFLLDLDLRPSEIHAVLLGDRVAYAPDAFAGHVQTLGESSHDWRRFPKRSAFEAIWSRTPTVALHLADADDLAAAVLVGASPASVRIGPHIPDQEPFYDLMVEDGGDVASRVVALRRALVQIDPPVLPLRT